MDLWTHQELQRLVQMAKPKAAYDLQSSNIIDMLKKMQLQFTKALDPLGRHVLARVAGEA